MEESWSWRWLLVKGMGWGLILALLLLGLLLGYNPPGALDEYRLGRVSLVSQVEAPPWLRHLLRPCGGRGILLPFPEQFLACPQDPALCLPDLQPPLSLFASPEAQLCLGNRSGSEQLSLIPLEDAGSHWSFRDAEFGRRALPKLALRRLGNSFLSFPAASPALFARALNASRWLGCNESLAQSFRQAHPDFYAKKALLPDSIMAEVDWVRDLFLARDALTFLFGGTLLGWYRECGLIPYTTDLDLAARAVDYSRPLEKDLIADRRARLYWILGRPNDSLELSVHVRPGDGSNRYKIDVFFLNEGEAKSDWVGGMIVWQKQKLRWDYPKLAEQGLCATTLLGHFVWVPCDVEGFLSADYGPNWHKPAHDSTFLWYKDHSNVRKNGLWRASEWAQVYRTSFS